MKENVTGRGQAGTSGKPYQDHVGNLGGDVAGKGGSGEMSTVRKVAESGAKSNPQRSREANPGDMKPDFYPGAALNQCGEDR